MKMKQLSSHGVLIVINKFVVFNNLENKLGISWGIIWTQSTTFEKSRAFFPSKGQCTRLIFHIKLLSHQIGEEV